MADSVASHNWQRERENNEVPQRPAKVVFGRPARVGGPEITWDAKTAINAHMLIAGGSGTGKTHQLRRIITSLAKAGARIHLLDVHGDIQPDTPTQTVVFSEQTEFGLNPLTVSPDRDFGGVRKRINTFVAMLDSQSRLGPKQEATLRHLMTELYARHGFYPNNPGSWKLTPDKKMPRVEDLRTYTAEKLRAMRLGGSAKAMAALEKLCKATQKLQRKGMAVHRGEAEAESLDGLKAECVELYKDAIESLETGREIDDILRYDSADTLASLLGRVETLEGAGIFRGKAPPFEAKNPVWRYDIKALARSEQQMFVSCLLEDLFFTAKQSGEKPAPDTFVIIDEASIFVQDDPDHIINILFREARKFGIGLILANQHMMGFSDDILMSAGVKLILGVDEIFQEGMRRRLGMDMYEDRGKKRNPLSLIVPRKTAFVAVKQSSGGTALLPGSKMTEIEILGT